MTCTSIGPDRRTTRLITDPPNSSCQRDARAGAEHDLGGVLGAGQVDEGGGDVVAGDPAVLAAELLEQPALRGHRLDGRCLVAGGQAGVGDDVDADEVALGPLGDARRPGG